jgi:hypothetical protein
MPSYVVHDLFPAEDISRVSFQCIQPPVEFGFLGLAEFGQEIRFGEMVL